MSTHAFLSPSASHRWPACPPSAKLCAKVTDQPSEYAKQGTNAHSLCAYLIEKALGRDVSDPVDADRQPILDRSEIYSGVKGRASINLYAYNVNGNCGIACGLNNLQKISDGAPLGGKSRAENDFATEDDKDFLD